MAGVFTLSKLRPRDLMVVDDQYKFIQVTAVLETIQLFDLKNDPCETTNLAYSSSHQDDCNRMATRDRPLRTDTRQRRFTRCAHAPRVNYLFL